ncbi:hypothetical protein [Azospirillum sp. A39]|uniref:hypothetical protein n=1 Tax=Azospirillum sp. A39 TaxID=3462279 RepID=UPI00404678E3
MTAPGQRRGLLAIQANPDQRHDYLVTLAGTPTPDTRLELRYVPDRWVIAADAFAAYLAGLAGGPAGLEALALAVLDDVNNEAVPRWAEVRVERTVPVAHRVAVEDRQPGWDNPVLMARLERL